MVKRPKRRHTLPRCRFCGQAETDCLCARLPRITTPFGWLLIQHAIEEHRPTNTGRMALRMLAPVRLLPYGGRHGLFNDAVLREPETDYVLLLPRPGAPVLRRADLFPLPGRRKQVILLDGSWRQATRMARRIGALRSIPAYALPPGAPGRWRIRRAPSAHHLCTLEAAIRLVHLAGKTEETRRLYAAMDLIQSGMLAMKGDAPRRPVGEARRDPVAGGY